MAITRQSVIDSINVREAGTIEVRRADRLVEGGQTLSESFHRHVLQPGDALHEQDAAVVKIARTVWSQSQLAASAKAEKDAKARVAKAKKEAAKKKGAR